MIFVKAYADLATYFGAKSVGEVIPYDNHGNNTCVKDIILSYNAPLDWVSIVLINGEYGELDSKVKDGDEVVFFSPVDGG